MADVVVLAGAEDYEALYGPVSAEDSARLDATLKRASGYLLSYLDGYEEGEDPVLDLNASTVCLAMAHRALCAPRGMEGVSQFSQTAGVYSASVSMRCSISSKSMYSSLSHRVARLPTVVSCAGCKWV